MERMKDLEEMLRELSEKYKNSKSVEVYEEDLEGWFKIIDDLREENKKLKEFKTKREESMFYFKALAERVEPINSKEAEELQKYKKLFERLYREELYYLEEENKKLKEEVRFLEECLDNKENVNKSLREELDKYKKQYEHSMGEDNGKLTKGGYASFNEYGELMEEDTLQELRDIGEI